MICACTLSTAVQNANPIGCFSPADVFHGETPQLPIEWLSTSSRGPQSLFISFDEEARNQISKLIWLVEKEPWSSFIRACALLFHGMVFRLEGSFMGYPLWKGQGTALAQTRMLTWIVYSQHTERQTEAQRKRGTEDVWKLKWLVVCCISEIIIF